MSFIDRILPRRNRAEGYPGKGLRRRPAPLRIAVVDRDKCRGTGDCEAICHYRRIRVGGDGKARIAKGCMGCGACAGICPSGAISMKWTVPTRGGTSGDA